MFNDSQLLNTLHTKFQSDQPATFVATEVGEIDIWVYLRLDSKRIRRPLQTHLQCLKKTAWHLLCALLP